ncbi:MAG: CoA transferase [Gammaproteobacteria bacterium]|nr:CoA transferase [Gammaproteobacteria bacterium]MCY4341961.1 CoA transferase [Gammaproteobacteria bacterium]
MDQPLAGVTVLDFGQIYNGPYCGFLLAQAGARVIKVESPIGEPLRARGEPSTASYAFALLNAGKEGITLNIKSAAGQAILKRLAREVDVVLENFAPGTMDRYGIGASALRRENPRLIYAAGTGYGATGPHRDYLGMDLTIQAMSGIMSITGREDTPPLKSGAALCDFFGGVHLYGAIVSALYQRQRTGEGAIIDIAMQDTVFPTLATALGAYYLNGEQGPRHGNRHPGLSLAPYNVYRARDGHVAMICIREGHWRRLIQAIGQPELGERPEFADMAGRAAHIDAVDALVEAWTEQRTRDEIFRTMQAHRVICASVQTLEEVVNDPHLHERGTLAWREHPGLGRIALCRTPLRYQGMTPPELTDSPALGADTQRVLRELGGYGEEEVEALRQAEAY